MPSRVNVIFVVIPFLAPSVGSTVVPLVICVLTGPESWKQKEVEIHEECAW